MRNLTLHALRATGLVGVTLLSPPTAAAETEQLLELRNTIVNLVDALVEQGVLSKEKAEAIKQEAALKAARDAAEARGAAVADAPAAPAAEPPAEGEAAAKQVVRVPYVPEFVKEEIREQVRKELRKDVKEDVLAAAKDEKWGIPDALPEWLSRISWHGDLRVRQESFFFADQNPDFQTTLDPAQYVFDPLTLNQVGVIDPTDLTNSLLQSADNTSEERHRQRVRARLEADIRFSDTFTGGLGFSTGNIRSPVSVNQDLGNTGRGIQVGFDRAFLRWEDRLGASGPQVRLQGGRFDNPWFTSDFLVWDTDLRFEGATVGLTQGLGGSAGSANPKRAIFLTLGAHPLEETDFSAEDKWIFGGQLGASFRFANDSRFRLGVAYYDYANISGRLNPTRPDPSDPANRLIETRLYDRDVPRFLQKGNTLFNVRGDLTPNQALNDPIPVALALASDYDLFNVTSELDLGYFAPYHVVLRGDFVENLGYDADEIAARTADPRYASGLALFNNFLSTNCTGRDCLKAQTLGYLVTTTVGMPRLMRFGDWQVYGGYRYLERDAVLDAFSESIWFASGTDNKGWILGGRYALSKFAFVHARYLTADQIDDTVRINPATGARRVDGAPLGIDVFNVDIDARF